MDTVPQVDIKDAERRQAFLLTGPPHRQNKNDVRTSFPKTNSEPSLASSPQFSTANLRYNRVSGGHDTAA